MVIGRSFGTGGLIRDDYEYALEGIAVDYVTNRPRSGSISRIRKNRQRINHLQNINNNPYPFASSSLSSSSSSSSSSLSSSSSSLSLSLSSSKDIIVYHRKSLMRG
ncbi:Mediator of RNA polymerase II transcription subunit [Dirofilaria immitis]|nr:hypothetical protein [Dirofilaria immitis]